MFPVSRILKYIRNVNERRVGKKILRNWKIKLSHPVSSDDASIIKEIFCDRIYSVGFPFYSKAVILDIGAHKGFFSIFAALNTLPDSRIIAIEPARSNFQSLVHNLETNKLPQIETVRKALGDRTGEVSLYLLKDKNHSLYQSYQPVMDNPGAEREPVESLTLTQMINRFHLDKIDFIKMDCEGAEYDILYHTSREILNKIRVLSIECHDLKDENRTVNHLANFLQASGFTLLRYDFLSTISPVHVAHLVAQRSKPF